MPTGLPASSRIMLAALAVAIAVLAITAAAPVLTSAEGATACGRFGDRSPDKLGERHAQRAIRCLLNRKRTRRGLPKLQTNRKLESAATKHTKHMRSTGCFDHNCSGEPPVESRLRNAGYLRSGLRSWSWGENIAYGSGSGASPRDMVRAWMNSPPHRTSILDRTFRDVGVGFRPGTPARPKADGGIYTTDFGYRR